MKLDVKTIDKAIDSAVKEINSIQAKVDAKLNQYEAQAQEKKKKFIETNIDPLRAKINELKSEVNEYKKFKAIMIERKK